MARTFNIGIGMVVIVAEADASTVTAAIEAGILSYVFVICVSFHVLIISSW
jgi:phosphoribosylaminoimidazole (AIR) synthetase